MPVCSIDRFSLVESDFFRVNTRETKWCISAAWRYFAAVLVLLAFFLDVFLWKLGVGLLSQTPLIRNHDNFLNRFIFCQNCCPKGIEAMMLLMLPVLLDYAPSVAKMIPAVLPGNYWFLLASQIIKNTVWKRGKNSNNRRLLQLGSM